MLVVSDMQHCLGNSILEEIIAATSIDKAVKLAVMSISTKVRKEIREGDRDI